MPGIDQARADLAEALASLERARDAMRQLRPGAQTPGRTWALLASIADTALKAAEESTACCSRLVALAEREPLSDELLSAITDAERAAVFACNAAVSSAIAARVLPDWQTE